MRLAIIRLEPDRFLERRRRFLVTLGPEINGAEIVVDLSTGRFERECFLVRCDRGFELLVLVKRGTEAVVSICVIAPESNRLLKLRDCFLEMPAIVKRRA